MITKSFDIKHLLHIIILMFACSILMCAATYAQSNDTIKAQSPSLYELRHERYIKGGTNLFQIKLPFNTLAALACSVRERGGAMAETIIGKPICYLVFAEISFRNSTHDIHHKGALYSVALQNQLQMGD